VEDSAGLARFYEHAYSLQGPQADRSARWRALSALGKADHVVELCRRAGLAPVSTLDVGCGDGALLAELSRRGFGGRRHGVEISAAAAQIARGPLGDDAVEVFDGGSLPMADGSYELGILSHVLEHVPEPASLLAETARVCRAVVFEVPLEANISAGRPAKRAHAVEIGHLHRLGRSDARAIAATAGLEIAAELQDPLPLAVHRFFATGTRARALALAKWGARAGADRVAPPLARRLFTVHYACLLVPPVGINRPPGG
jgi:SAM-dependent methyltransferase